MAGAVSQVKGDSGRHVGSVYDFGQGSFTGNSIEGSDKMIGYRIHDRFDYENNLLTDVFPSWFFFSTYRWGRRVSAKVTGEGRTTHFRNCKLKIFLCHMLSSLSQGIHSCFCAYTSDLCTGALAHLFGERPKVDSTLQRHLSALLNQNWAKRGI